MSLNEFYHWQRVVRNAFGFLVLSQREIDG